MKNYLALAGAIAAASCVSVDTDPTETGTVTTGPIVEFDPGNSIVPFPNNLLLDRTTGKVNLPAQCGESPLAGALRQLVLNALDGFGTFKSAQRITFSEPVDMASLAGNIVMYRRATGTTPVDPAAAAKLPLVFIPGKTERFTADCSSSKMVDSLAIVPAVPLDARSTYTVAVLKGVKGMSGAEFGPSSTWGLIRQAANPVTVVDGVIVSERTPLDPGKDKTTLIGLDGLWKAHAQALGFVTAASQKTRGDVVVAWEFNTQTTTTPLDPAVPGTPAANAPKAPIASVTSVLGGDTVSAHMEAVLVAFGAPAGTCTVLNCASVGDVLNGTITAPNYQSPGANPLAGGAPVPGPFSNPVTPTKINDAALSVRILVPTGTAPTAGWPTIVFGHGLAGNRLLSYFVASQLARAGFATVSIDFVAHGSRAVRTSNAAALGCADAGTPPAPPNPGAKPQCFAPIFSTNLATTRDNVRQSVLDVQTLVQSLKLCTPAAPCGGFSVNSAKIGYLAISLGGIIGSIIVGTTPDIKGSVLNVPGVGLVDILENTASLPIKCATVDGLIDAGVITGAKWNGMTGATATGACTTDAWRAQPAYQTFSNIARWILDSGDGANFNKKLAARRILIQEVVNDQVVPNVATDTMGALVGLTPGTADSATSATPAPSAALTTNPQTNKWVRYPNLPAASPFPGNSFAHGSLLVPANGNPDGQLGTARVQTDAIYFLIQNVSL
jgi:alpha-beta hydrolase superfamily lysophospholipase